MYKFFETTNANAILNSNAVERERESMMKICAIYIGTAFKEHRIIGKMRARVCMYVCIGFLLLLLLFMNFP